MAEVILSPFEGEEYELTDPEGRRLFGLSVYERALLSEDELRRHEVEFLEWLRYCYSGSGTFIVVQVQLE
jgi:hypothetical protein